MNDIMVEKNVRWEMEVNFQSGVNRYLFISKLSGVKTSTAKLAFREYTKEQLLIEDASSAFKIEQSIPCASKKTENLKDRVNLEIRTYS